MSVKKTRKKTTKAKAVKPTAALDNAAALIVRNWAKSHTGKPAQAFTRSYYRSGGGFTLAQLHKRVLRYAAPAKKAAPKRNGKTVIKAKRVTVLKFKNPSLEIIKEAAPTTKGSQQGWKLGKSFYAKGRGQQKLPGGALLDLGSGFVYRRVANPKRRKNVQMMGGGGLYPIRASADYDPALAGEKPSRKSAAAQKRTRKAAQKKIKAAGGVKKYIRKIKTRKAATRKASQSRSMTAATKARKATTTRLASRSLQRSVPLKKTRRNPDTPAQKLQEFRGYPKDRDDNLRFPNGTPSGLYRLGVLKKIVTTHNTINMPSNQVWLCADTKGKLYVGGLTKGAAKGRVVNAPAGSLGKVTRIEYLEKKPHLRDFDKTLYFHKMGEEDGNKPTLYSDGDGNLLFKGGNYEVTYLGIVN